MARSDFETHDPQDYDPNEIWIKASDTHGHSTHLRVNVPKHWGGQISSLIDSGKFGYRTLADFGRDAVYHRLHWASQIIQDEAFLGRLTYDRLNARLDHFLVESEGFAAFNSRVDEAAAVAERGGDFYEFARVVDMLRDEAMVMLREPFRSQTIQKLDAEYERFMDSHRRANP